MTTALTRFARLATAIALMRALACALLGVVAVPLAHAQLRTPTAPQYEIPQRYISPGNLEIHRRPAVPVEADPVAYASTFFGQARGLSAAAVAEPCTPSRPMGSGLNNPTDCLPSRYLPVLPQGTPGPISGLRPGIDNQNAWYQYALGRAYDVNGALPTEYAEAAKWYAIAGDPSNIGGSGVHPDAQYQLATMYDTGIGVRQSNPQALQWYQAASSNGSAAAYRDLTAFTANRDYAVAPGGGVLYAKQAALSGYGERWVLPPGQTVLVYERFPEWLRVYAPQQQRWGWMRKDHVRFRF